MNIYKDTKNKLGLHWPGHTLFIDVDDRWIKKDLNNSDIIPLIYHDEEILLQQISELQNKLNENQTILILHYFHIDDNYDESYYEEIRKKYTSLTKNVYLVHKNFKNDHSMHIYFDHMFNRQKLYCTDWSDKLELDNRTWTWGAVKDIYSINKIEKTNKLKYIAPNRIYGDLERPRMKIRLGLNYFLKQHYSNDGLINDPAQGNLFYPNGVSSDNDTTQVARPNGEGGTWYPIGDQYYADTYVSIYTESISIGDSVNFISEKTFDPLMKGNYILPFGYCGMIKFMQEHYDIKIPDWIDYSYDTIQDDRKRLESYLKTVASVLNNTLDFFKDRYVKDQEIIQHNINLFFDRSYDNLYDAVKEKIK